MELYIIRHSPVALSKGICYGQADVGVDGESFAGYVELFKKQLPSHPDKVFSSDLKRCHQLTNALYKTYQLDSRLREIHFGDWELKKWEDISINSLTEWSANLLKYAPENGENLQQLYQRVEAFLNELRHTEARKIVLVTHAGVIRCIWTYILQMPIENCVRIPIDFGEVFQVYLGEQSVEDRIIRKGGEQ